MQRDLRENYGTVKSRGQPNWKLYGNTWENWIKVIVCADKANSHTNILTLKQTVKTAVHLATTIILGHSSQTSSTALESKCGQILYTKANTETADDMEDLPITRTKEKFSMSHTKTASRFRLTGKLSNQLTLGMAKGKQSLRKPLLKTQWLCEIN